MSRTSMSSIPTPARHRRRPTRRPDQRRSAGGGDGRGTTGVGTGRREPYVGGLGPRPDEDGPVGDPGPSGRGQRADDQRRSLVGPEEGGHPLGVGLADDAVVRCRGGDVLGGADLGEPGVGVGCRHLGERREQRPHGPSVLGGVVPGPGRHHALEQGIDVHGRQQADGGFAGPDSGKVVAHHRVGWEVGAPQLAGQARRPSGPGRPDGLGSGDHGHRQGADGDGRGGPVDQPLRAVAARWSSTSHAAGRAPIRPANSAAGADPERVMMSTTDRRSMRSRSAGADSRAWSARPSHEVDRGDQLGALDGLAGGHDHRDALGVVGGGVHRMEVDTLVSGRKLPSPTDTHRTGSSGPLGARRTRTGSATGPAFGTCIRDPLSGPAFGTRIRDPQRLALGKVGTLSSIGQSPTMPDPDGGGLGEGFLFGVATAGLPGRGWVQRPRPTGQQLVRPGSRSAGSSRRGTAMGFWERPEESLDRAAELGCNSFRLSVEWARVALESGRCRPGGAGPLRGHRAGAVSTVGSSRWSRCTTSPTRSGWATTSGSGRTPPTASGPGPRWLSTSWRRWCVTG